MGLRGPKSTPTALKLLQGNPGKRPLNLADGVNPLIRAPSPPSWLSPQALKEWRRITGELLTLGLIAEIDKASLSTYCQTWGDLCDLEAAFAAQKKKARDSDKKSDTVVMAAYFQKTPTGFLRESAIHKKIIEMRSELDRYVRNFGLNPSARARVQASNMLQPQLPGFESDAKPDGFGMFKVVQGG